MKNIRTRTITGIGILLAIEIILQIIGNIWALGPVSINLSLIPIALGAIIYGPLAGAFLGLANGGIVLLAPATQAIFWQVTPLGTLLVCLLKCTIAGFVSGLIFRLINKKNKFAAVIIASLIVPIINTGLFALGCFTVFRSIVESMCDDGSLYTYVFLVFIGWNFVFEFLVTSILSPTVYKIVSIHERSLE